MLLLNNWTNHNEGHRKHVDATLLVELLQFSIELEEDRQKNKTLAKPKHQYNTDIKHFS